MELILITYLEINLSEQQQILFNEGRRFKFVKCLHTGPEDVGTQAHTTGDTCIVGKIDNCAWSLVFFFKIQDGQVVKQELNNYY